jgi:zinc finger CCHC domain-containing protein 8
LIDATPTANESTPRYNALNTPVLSNTKEPQKSEKRFLASNNKCFNCDGDHALRDCTEPRNMGKIRKARNDFNRRELRYHDDDNNEYSQLVPGAISDELKEALRLVENEIPLHVYKMRVYGYPPAWLEEAKIQQSGLALFTGNDSEKVDSEVAIKFDVQKIYDFPGFNVQPEGQFVDKGRLFGLPPMLPQHSKEFLIQSLGENIVNGYKKRKIKDNNEFDSTSCEEVEMEIADDDEENSEMIPLGKTYYQNDTLPPGVSEPSPEDGECSNDSSTDLEAKKKALMSELEADDEEMTNSCIIENSVNENNDNSSRDITIGQVETTVFGTPVLPSFSPFESLPQGEKFMAGVSDVIAFENLAESTGKYDHMRELIKKVRIFQQKHQHE